MRTFVNLDTGNRFEAFSSDDSAPQAVQASAEHLRGLCTEGMIFFQTEDGWIIIPSNRIAFVHVVE